MIGFHHYSIHLIQVGCKKSMAINTKALCSICRKTFNLSNMGHWALLSHEQSENHKKNVKSMKVQSAFFKKSENSAKGSSENQISLNAASCSNKQQLLDKFVTQDEVTGAELLWAMNVSYKHVSYRFCSDVVFLFQLMFTDSNIASQVWAKELNFTMLLPSSMF